MNGVFKFRSVTSVVIASAETGRDTRNKIVLSTEKKRVFDRVLFHRILITFDVNMQFLYAERFYKMYHVKEALGEKESSDIMCIRFSCQNQNHLISILDKRFRFRYYYVNTRSNNIKRNLPL